MIMISLKAANYGGGEEFMQSVVEDPFLITRENAFLYAAHGKVLVQYLIYKRIDDVTMKLRKISELIWPI